MSSTAEVPQNIATFNYVVLSVFIRLYEAFPGGVNLDPAMLMTEIAPKMMDIERAPTEELAMLVPIIADAIEWLEEEGFIRTKHSGTFQRSVFISATLSLKGLTVFGYLPASVAGAAQEERETLVTQAGRLMKGAAKDATREAVKGLITKMFTLAFQYGVASFHGSSGPPDASTGIDI